MGFMHSLIRTLLLIASVSTGLAAALPAQGVTTAALFGTLIGDSTALEGAVVEVTNTATGERWQTATRARGRFVFEYLSVGGPYVIEARAIGYAPEQGAPILLSLGERRRVDFTLRTAVLELPEIAVLALDPLVNPARTGPAQLIGDSLISRMPVRSRDFAQLVYLSPQAVLTPSGGVSIAGQSDRLNGFQIDGATNLDLTGFAGGGGFGTPAASSGVRTLSVEALQELQILTAPFDVRYGTFAGGLVNAVTRSGSNRWQGSLSGYFEDRGLTGKDSTGRRAADFSTRELAFTLSGPIARDRAAFFLDIGLQRDLIPQSVPGIGSDTTGGADSAGVGIRYASAVRFQEILRNTYGVEPGTFASVPARLPSGNLFAKITLQPAVNNRLELSHNFGRGTPDFPGFREPYQAYALSSNGSQGPATVNATRLNWTTARGSQISNELNLAYLRVRERERCPAPGGYSEVFVAVDESFLVAGDGFSCTTNFSDQDVWELTDNLTWFRGSHQLTFGTHSELIRTRRLTRFYPLGSWGFASLDSLAAGLAAIYSRTLPNPALPEEPGSNLGINQLGFYLQDQWAATPRLTVTAGLRMDVPFVTSSPIGNPLLRAELGINNSLTPSGNTLWSPRLGFSYDLGGKGFLRGGVGLFSGRPAYHWLGSVFHFNGLDAAQLFCDETVIPTFTLDPVNQPTTCGDGAVVSRTEVNYFDPSFRFPRNFRAAVGTDLRLPWGVVGTVDLLYVRGVNQIYVTDVNLEATGTAAGEGGRVLYGALDPATGKGTPNRLSDAFGPVIEVRNSSGDRSYVATAELRKRFVGGAEIGAAYTYTDSKDRLSAAGDLASVNIGATNILDGTLDQRRLAASRYSVPHKITLVGALDLPLRARFSLFYNGFSGSPYTYRIEGDANADGLTAFGSLELNDPVYVPRDAADITLADPGQWEELDSYIRSRRCLEQQRGQLLRRNSCRNPWVSLMNARLSKVFPTVRGQSVELIADLFNVLNFLDGDWAVRRGIGGTAILQLVGYDSANQRGIYVFQTRDPLSRDLEATRWRVQLGARYTF
jgi:hypothetical protein